MELLDVIGSGNIHRCREVKPYEATIYGLGSEKLQSFEAVSKTDLTLAVGGNSQEEPNQRNQITSLELPVEFSRESLEKVRITFSQTILIQRFFFLHLLFT